MNEITEIWLRILLEAGVAVTAARILGTFIQRYDSYDARTANMDQMFAMINRVYKD